MKCVEVYKELYHQEPFDVAFCPYRISPLGAHIDHQYGKINGLAIDKGIHMAYHPKQNGVVELQSLNFPKRAQFFVSAVPDEKQGDWADHLRGAGDNVLDFSLSKFVEFAKEKNTSCVMCHEENELKKQQKTAIITLDGNDLITSYEEKPTEPKGNLAVPPFYCYRACDVKRIQEALENGCGYDAPGSFAAWLSKQTPMHAYVMPGKRYDIGDINSYEYVKSVFSK